MTPTKREKQQGPAKLNSPPWFVRDDPIADLSTEDSFGHRAYSEVLADAILAAQPPFTIGVFGDWGVGKTTITKTHLAGVLKAKLKERPLAYAYFDVWKYEGDSLRRQFLRDVAQQLNDNKVLKSYDPEKELEDLVVDKHDVVEGGLSLSMPRLLVALVRGVIGFVLAYVALQVLGNSTKGGTGQDIVASVIIGAVFAFSSELSRVVVVNQREMTRKSIDSPELFEAKFKHLMESVTADRVVIVIDNLDRCSPDRVIEVLATIKTFLEPSKTKVQPIFVIPCDESAIRRHLEKRGEISKEDADEYLRKFFNVAIRITPILQDEIRDYAARELDALAIGADLTDEHRRELGQVISVAFRENPRRVKQFLNTLTSKRMLLRAREAAGAIDPKISDEVPFLAKLTVIEEEWPGFYDLVQEDSRVFDQLSQHAIGVEVPLAGRIEKPASDERLLAFLRGTRRTTSPYIRAFTRLKLAPTELGIANYSEFRNALVDGRIEEVGKILADSPEDGREPYRNALLQILKDESANGYFEAALNVADAAVRRKELRSADLVLEVAEQLYVEQGLRALLPSLAPYETLVFLRGAESDAAKKLVSEYMDLLGREDLGPAVPKEQLPKWQSDVARGLVATGQELSSDEVTRLRDLANGTLAGNVDFVHALADSRGGPELYIGEAALSAAVGRIAVEDLTVSDDGSLIETPASGIWIRSLEIAEDQAVSTFAKHATDLFTQMAAEESVPGRRGLLELLIKSRSTLVQLDSAVADALQDQVRNQYPYVAGHEHWQVIAVLAALYTVLSPTGQEQVDALVVQFAAEEARDVGQFVAFAATDGLDAMPDPVRSLLWTSLKDRFRNTSLPQEAQGLAGIFVTHVAPQLGWSDVEELLGQAIDADAFTPVAAALEAFAKKLEPGLLKRVVGRLLGRLTALPPSQQEEPFRIVLSLPNTVRGDERRMIRDHVVASLCSDDASVRDVGLRMIDQGEDSGVIRDAERRYVVEQVVLWLGGRIESIDASYLPLLGRLTQDIELAGDSSLENLINVLRGMLPRGSAERSIAAQYLVKLSLTPKRREEVVEELVHWAKQEPEESARHELTRRAAAIGSQDKRSRAWKAIDGYLRELKDGEDESSRVLASELLDEGEEAAH
jgi:hypothetical protein